MGKLKYEDVEQSRARLHMRIWRFGGWLSRTLRRSCSGGMWTISRDGKLGCEPLYSDSCQPD